MLFSLISPEKALLEIDAAMVIAPGVEGEFGALPGHAPFISLLKPGIITVEGSDGITQRFGIAGGVAEVTPERMVVLCENAKALAGLSEQDVQDWLAAQAPAAVAA